MVIECPDCLTKMRPKPPEGTPEGTKVSVTCRCGTKLRFTMPGKPKPDPRDMQWITDMLKRSGGAI